MSSHKPSLPGAVELLRQVLPLEAFEPISLVASRSWSGHRKIRGTGFTVSAHDIQQPSRDLVLGARAIPMIGAGMGIDAPDGRDDLLETLQIRRSRVLRVEFDRPSVITDLQLGLLHDSPECARWEASTRIDVLFSGAHPMRTFMLHAQYLDASCASASWDGSAMPWRCTSAWSGGPGLWSNGDPFAGRAVTRLDLHTARSSPAHHNDDRSARPPSDCVFRALEAHPLSLQAWLAPDTLVHEPA